MSTIDKQSNYKNMTNKTLKRNKKSKKDIKIDGGQSPDNQTNSKLKKDNTITNTKDSMKDMIKSFDSQALPINELFKLVDLYFKQKNVMYHHLYNSFDKFIDDDIRMHLEEGNNVFFEKVTKDKVYRYKFLFNNIALKPPTLDTDDELMFPSHARTRNMTYSAKLVANITQIQEVTDIATNIITTKVIGQPENEVPIATIPIMVRSKYCSLNIKKEESYNECEFDPGGYFIVNGAEKVVMSLEKMVDNKPLVFTKKDSNSLIYTVQVNSKPHNAAEITQVIAIRMKKDGIMNIRVPILNELPVVLLFRALGIESDKEIINMICYDENDTDMINLIRISLENSKGENSDTKIMTQESAYDYLIQKIRVIKKYNETDNIIRMQQKRMHLESLLLNNLIPHIDPDATKKAYYLGYMINRLLHVRLGRIPKDDRDSFVNKRIDLPGNLMFELFRQYYKKMLNECNKFFKKRNTDDNNPMNIINQIKPNIIEQGLKAALLTGAWGKKKGVAQMLQRLTYLQTVSSLRRINSPTVDASTNKLTSPRHLHGTQIPCICFIETPEGHKVGLVKNLSLLGNVTIMLNSQIYILKGILKNKLMDLHDASIEEFKKSTKVFLNGEWLGITQKPRDIYNQLKSMKLNSQIDPHVSIVHEINPDIGSKEIKIYCDGGRLFRPAIRVENNEYKLTQTHIDLITIDGPKTATNITSWNEFMTKNPGVIEYLDTDENSNSMIGMYETDIINMKHRETESRKMAEKIGNDVNVVNRYDNMMFIKYTHCEIHASLLIGLVASTIPFCNHNHGPRNVFQYSQAKQAMGIFTSNYRDRLDISYILYNPQRPLLTTRAMKYTHVDRLPSGENIIVAIACYTGYNIEDSTIMNQSAIDRGLFRSTSLKKYITTVQKNQSTSQDDIFVKPDKNKVAGIRKGSYDKLNEKGYVPEETKIENGDFILGKVSPIQPVGNSNKTFKDSSEAYKSGVPGCVDRVWSGIYNHEGYEMRKMRVRSLRIPHIGDKVCCYTDDHDVLTDMGWVKISELTLGHKVASLIDGKLVYINPVALQEYDFEGELYVIETNQVSLRVTKNHRMYVGNRNKKYKVIEAENLFGKTTYYKKNADTFDSTYAYLDYPNKAEDYTQIKEYNNNDLVVDNQFKFDEHLKINEKGEITHFRIFDKNGDIKHEFDIDAWLYLYGIWLAEGSSKQNTSGNYTNILIAAHKDRVKDKLNEIEPRLGINIKKGYWNKEQDIKNNTPFNCYTINNINIGSYLSQSYVPNEENKHTGPFKKLFDWVWQLSPKQAEILFNGMMLGDGHITNNKKGEVIYEGPRRYDTSSIQLRDDVQKLALHFGKAANYSLKSPAGTIAVKKSGIKIGEQITQQFDAWRLTIIETQFNPIVNKLDTTKKIGKQDYYENYKGKVYCCTVPTKDGIIYVRRRNNDKGISVWCGNSKHG